MDGLTLLLNQHNDSSDAEELLPLLYNDLRRLAAARLAAESAAYTLQPTALVHEAWLRVFADNDRRWESRAHFFAEAAQAMRRILIESARRKSRQRHGGGWSRVDIDSLTLAAATPDDRILLIDEALERLEMLDPVRARVVIMKFFGGLTNQEAADILGSTERTIERQWAFAKAWLFQNIREQL